MNPLDILFEQLMRAAAQAPRAGAEEPLPAPDARWLLRQRERALRQRELATRSVLRVALATACVVFVATLAFSLHHLRQANQDVFTTSQVALTRVTTP